MRRWIQGIAVLVLLVAAFLAGRWSGDTPNSAQTQDMAGSADTGVVSDRTARAADAAAEARVESVGPNALPTRPPATPTPSARDLPRLPEAKPSPDVPISPSAPGPQPLTAEDERALASAERGMAADGGTGRDLLDLANKERADTLAPQLEALIAQTILQHGGNYTALRLSPPHCSRSVCIVRAVGTGTTQNPRSDWQRLNSIVVNEPWFRESFDDVRGMVGSEGADTVYVTMYVRCEPGTCRMARR